MDSSIKAQADLGRIYTDFSGFDTLRTQAKNNDPEALKKVVKQFESLFVDMMLKNMRSANEVFSEDNELNSEMMKSYQEMFDHQISIELSEGKGIGLAEAMEKQLSVLQGKAEDSLKKETLVNENKSLDLPEQNLILKEQAKEVARQRVAAGEWRPLFKTPIDFVKAMWPHAVEAAKSLNTDPKVLLAQAALETRWGRSIIRQADGSSSHNLFGIKADNSWQKDKVLINTLEYSNGMASKQVAPFRSYSSYGESFADYVRFLRENPRYKTALSKTNNPAAFTEALQSAGYATDPNYAKKIQSVYHSDTLARALNNGQ